MAAKIAWGPLQRATSAAGEKVVARNFDLRARNGYLTGQIVIAETSDDTTATVECKNRLEQLLREVIKELG